MPLVEVPEIGTVEFPDEMSQADIVSAIENDIIPKQRAKLQSKPMGNSEIAMPKTFVPEPGSESPAMNRPAPSDLPTQAFQTTPQPAPQRQIKQPQVTLEQALIEGVRQEPPAPEAQVELPRFGEEGSVTRGVSDVAAGLGEWAINRPEEFVGTLLSAPVKAAVELRYVPEIAAHFVEDVRAGLKGDKEATGRALAIFATVAAPKALEIGKRTIETAKARTEIQGATASLNDLTARSALDPQNAQINLGRKILPTTEAEMSTGTDRGSVTFADAPDRGERRAILKSQRPEVPETPPEPQKGLTVLEEIRQKGATTKEQIRALYPHLSREEAAALRDQAFPKVKTPDNLSPKQAEDVFRLDEFSQKANEAIDQFEAQKSAEPKPEPEAQPTAELPPRPSNDANQPAAENVPVPDVAVPVPEKPAPKPKSAKAVEPGERPRDIIDEIEERVGKIRGKGSAKPGEEGYYTDAYRQAIKNPHVRKLFTNQAGAQSIDSAIDALRKEKIVGPDFSADDLHDALFQAAQARKGWKTGAVKEAKAISAEEAQRVDFEDVALTPDPEAKKPVNVSDLLEGDEFELAGEKVKVKKLNFDEDGNFISVEVEDGKRFGVQEIRGEATIFPDRGEVKKADVNTEFVPGENFVPEVNHELNMLKAKKDPTAIDKARIRQLEAELGQKDLLDVPPEKTPEAIEAEKKAAAEKERIAELQNKKLKGEDALEQNLFDEDKDLFGAKPEDVARANSTSRTAGAVGAKAITPRYVEATAKPGETFLDFGSGKDAAHAQRLKEAGLDVTAYDFGGNVKTGIHDPSALERSYDTVYASNVLNVQSGREMLMETLNQIAGSTKNRAVFNYPESPRYTGMRASEVAEAIKEVFGNEPKRVGGTSSAPLWEVKKSDVVSGATPAAPAPLAPVVNPVPVKTPKGQRQIITDIAKGLKIPVRFGRLLHRQFGGYFMPKQDLIVSKYANDIPVVTHEAGHKLDKEFGFSSEPALRPELDVLGDNATPGSMSSWNKKKTIEYKMKEGVAEFVRYWLTDDAHARTVAPNAYARFEAVLDANKDFGDVMRQAKEDIRIWRTSNPEARFDSHISTGTNPNKTRYTLSQLTRDTIDDLHFFDLATRDAQKARTAPLDPSENAYIQARLLRGSYGMAESFINRGVADFKTKEVTMGTSLEDALKPVAGRLNEFRRFIVAKRALELEGQGKKTGFVLSDINAVIAKYGQDPEFNSAFQKVKDWQDALLQYAVDAGLVTPEGASAMREMNQDYVPFHRIFEVGAGEPSASPGGGTGKGMNVGSPTSLRRMQGSNREIVDPIETMMKNAYSLITAAEKAHIQSSLADYFSRPGMGKWVEKIGDPKDMVRVGVEKIRKQLEDAGADLTNVPDSLMLKFYQTAKRAPFGENTIRIMRNGRPEFLRLDKDLFETFNALDLEDAGALIRLYSQPAQLLRAGVVLEPFFGLANAIKDTVGAAVMSKYGSYPFEMTIHGLVAIMGNKKVVAEWMASGGKNSIEASFFDRDKMQQVVRDRVSKEFTPAEKASIIVRSPLTALRWLTELAEDSTRVGEYMAAMKQLTKAGMPPGEARRLAAFEARDRQDFAKGGAKTKIIRRITPFWNAMLQANVKLATSIKQRPFQMALRGIAFVTLPTLLEQAINYDDRDYWDRPQWERDAFWLIPRGKDANNRTKFFRIPKPFEIGTIFGTLPSRIIQFANEKGEPATQSYLRQLLVNSVPNFMSPTEKVIVETALTGKQGWDIFRGREIVPDRLADLPADMQWTEQNSLTAKKIGALFGVSPMKVDHIIRSTTGGLGSQAVHNVADPIISAATGERRTAKGKNLAARFLTTPAGSSSQSVETFYEYMSKIDGENQRMKLTGRAKDFYLLQKDFHRASEEMRDLRKQAREATNDNERQRYQLQIADIARDMNRLAREFGLK